MDDISRLKLLTGQMHLEPSEDVHCMQMSDNKQDAVVVTTATRPDGSKIKVLKTLLTSVCERDCYYCPFRSDRDFRRATFTPDEFSRLFISLAKARAVEGLFLSSGVINGGVFTQDKLIATAELLRKKYHFSGYIHLKIMPGAEKSQIEQAMFLADRVSINLEAPNPDKLNKLAPCKNFSSELIPALKWIEETRQNGSGRNAWNGHWPSSVTQFVVGAVGDTDIELLSTSQQLFKQYGLKRTYYSAFTPITDTPLENHPPISPTREHRLYEASFLLRDYGFDVEEFVFDPTGNLPGDVDPKMLWAQYHLVEPLEINRADQFELLRVPGIGKKGAALIIAARRKHPLHHLSELHTLGINTTRAAPFLMLNGKRPTRQLSFQI
jgi:predicted DNA-binding helix-hairpin-helix protein